MDTASVDVGQRIKNLQENTFGCLEDKRYRVSKSGLLSKGLEEAKDNAEPNSCNEKSVMQTNHLVLLKKASGVIASETTRCQSQKR